MCNSHVKLRTYLIKHYPALALLKKSHSREEQLKEASDVSVSHFLLSVAEGLFYPSLIPDTVGQVEVYIQTDGDSFWERTSDISFSEMSRS